MNYDGYISQMMQQTEANNVFNAQQASLNRDFQKEMSDTAHQREVKDLIAAGLNPVLSANAGASTASGSMATADTSSAQGFANLAKTGLDGTISLALAEINKSAQIEAARISAEAVMQSAATAASASMYSSDQATWSKPIGALYKYLDSASKSLSGMSVSQLIESPLGKAGILGALVPYGKAASLGAVLSSSAAKSLMKNGVRRTV